MKNLNTIAKNGTRTLNGGSITVCGVAGGLMAAYGTYEACKGFINIGIGIGNKIFKNNAKYL